jgi:hypothetical protein
MNQHLSAIGVIRARLPYLDRDALSRAWFEALQLAAKPSFAPQSARGPATSGGGAARARVFKGSTAKGAGLVARPAFDVPRSRRTASSPLLLEVRAFRERRVARSFVVRAASAPEPTRTAHVTLTLEGARVQILVRRRGDRLDVVALCSAKRVELVRRALAGVDVELRSLGADVNSHVGRLVCA